jgi:hypothetical protein
MGNQGTGCPLLEGRRMELDYSLIARVRRREVNFEQLVEVLSTRGYVTDSDGSNGLGFGRAAIDQARQHDFDALFILLMPGELNTIRLMSHGTDKGGVPGSFTTALFNTNVIEYEEMNQVLIAMNRQQNEEL